MCGIIGYVGKNNADDILLSSLSRLEYRGYDSAGITVIAENSFKTFKTTKRIESLAKKVDTNANIGIGHTRWATHGAPTKNNAHPHLSNDCKFAVVHNGIIENYIELKSELIKDGVNFKSDTDTEVVPHLLSKYYNGDLKAAVLKTVSRLKGAFALGVLCTDYPDTLVGVKNFSPLALGLGDNASLIASDIVALYGKASKVIFLEDGELAFLKAGKVNIFDFSGEEIIHPAEEITETQGEIGKGEYEYYMMKEIKEQPEAIKRALKDRIYNGEICFENSKLTQDLLQKTKLIHIVACGSAYHAGLAGKYVFEELLRIPTVVDHASEFRYRNPIANESTLTIAISQSGETADTLAAVREAKKRGSFTLAIVNVAGSSIAKAADEVLLTNAGPEIAVATTKGYITQLCLLYLFALKSAALLNKSDSEEIKTLTSELELLPQKIDRILLEQNQIKELAKKLRNSKSVFFIGRNMDYAASLEASLKLKEITYIHSEAYPSGELKHGTISLIEEGTPVFALCCYSRLFEKQLSNIKEVTARGGVVTACVSDTVKLSGNEVSECIIIPQTHHLFTAALEVIPFQLLAYYTALYKGLDIDKPRNLAKSVTVE